MQNFVCDFLLESKRMISGDFKEATAFFLLLLLALAFLIFHAALLEEIRKNQTTLWHTLQMSEQMKKSWFTEHLLLNQQLCTALS